MIKYITSLFASLNKNSHPGEIAHAVCLAALLAVLPKNNLLWPILFIIMLFIRINKGAFFIFLIILGFISPFCDVVIERLGFWVLNLKFMRSIYFYLDTTPFVGLTKFYNSMVMGGLLSGLLIYLPNYFLSRFSVAKYRKFVRPALTKFVNSRIAPVLRKIPILRHFTKLNQIGETFTK